MGPHGIPRPNMAGEIREGADGGWPHVRKRWRAILVLIALVAGTGGRAVALQCNGRIVSLGESKREV
jgi:hypothetical protein